MALKATSEARSAEERSAQVRLMAASPPVNKTRTNSSSSTTRPPQDHRRAILVLVIDHLTANGYTEAAAALEREGGAPLQRFAAADNVDLASIVREYEVRQMETFMLSSKKRTCGWGGPPFVAKVGGSMTLRYVFFCCQAYYELKLGRRPKLVRKTDGDGPTAGAKVGRPWSGQTCRASCPRRRHTHLLSPPGPSEPCAGTRRRRRGGRRRSCCRREASQGRRPHRSADGKVRTTG